VELQSLLTHDPMPHLSLFPSGAGHGGPNNPPDSPPSPLVIPIFLGLLVVIAVVVLSFPYLKDVVTRWRLKRQEIQPPKWSDKIGGEICASNRLYDACHDAVQQSRLIFPTFEVVTPTKTDFVHLHSSLGHLRASSRELSHLCGLLWHAIPPNKRQNLLDEEQMLEEQIQCLLNNPLDAGDSSPDAAHRRELLRARMQIRLKIFEQVPPFGSQVIPLRMQVYRGKWPISRELEIQKGIAILLILPEK